MDKEQVMAWLMTTLQQITEATQKAADFAAGELPIFVKEFITFNVIWHWSMLVLVTVVCVALLSIAIMVGKRFQQESGGASWVGTAFVSFMSLIIWTEAGLTHLKPALMASFAPRVFLLTELIKFFK